ncbi:MFS transporter [Nocardiopsis alba]|uniref:MFS transporter n=1 Tax=Nocardiopsis alba TaxID=53437 RepID=UPI00364C58CC
MITTWNRLASFDPAVRLLMVNQLTINAAFFMLMPYLAFHLTDSVGVAVWAVGLILGARNLCQQGMFLVGAGLAERFGHKSAIMAGCGLRTIGFAALGFADSLVVLLLASALTGFAGALFNPAVRAYLAAAAGERRVEAFALFNVFYQVGSLIGPLLGMALLAVDFTVVATVAAILFAALTVWQWLALPTAAPGTEDTDRESGRGVIAGIVDVFRDGRFLLIAVAMSGTYLLNFQVYLSIPLATQDAAVEVGLGADQGRYAVAFLFLVTALVTIVGQVRVAAWIKERWGAAQALPAGAFIMATAFLPMLAAPALIEAASGSESWVAALVAVTAPGALTVALLGLGTMVAYPFEMDTVVRLAGRRSVALHYGLYNTCSGAAITLGNLLVGAGLDVPSPEARSTVWLSLALVGAVCATATALIGRAGWYSPRPEPEPVVEGRPV